MSYTQIRFPWSRYNPITHQYINSYQLSEQDIKNKQYKYYYNNIPIYHISDYHLHPLVDIITIDGMKLFKIDTIHIKDISQHRNTIIEQILMSS